MFQRYGKAERNARLTVGEDKVFGDDFTDVDVRENYATIATTKSKIRKAYIETTHKERPTGFYSADLLLCLIDLFYWG